MAGWFSTPTIRDDRGREVPFRESIVPSPQVLRRVREAEKARLPTPSGREIARALGQGLIMAGVSLAAMLVPVWLSIRFRVGGRALRVTAFLVGVGVMMLGTVWLARVTSLRRRALVRRSAGLCAACGYDLGDVPEEGEDPCRVCPECGSAWRIGAERGPG